MRDQQGNGLPHQALRTNGSNLQAGEAAAVSPAASPPAAQNSTQAGDTPPFDETVSAWRTIEQEITALEQKRNRLAGGRSARVPSVHQARELLAAEDRLAELYARSDALVRDVLRSARVVAVVGLSANDRRPSFRVACYLKEKGYHVVPINPTVGEVLGEKSYARLEDIPFRVDVVDVFRRQEDLLSVAEAAVRKKAKVLWIQEGTLSPKTVTSLARQGSTLIIMNRCLMMEHRRLLGS